MFFILLIGIVLLGIATYNVLKKDLFAPACIVSIVFFISAICALINYNTWNLQNYHAQTVGIILLCLSIFSLTSYIVYRIFYSEKFQNKINKTKEKKQYSNKYIIKAKEIIFENKNEEKIIHINRIIQIIIILIFIAVIAYNFYEIYRISHLNNNPGSFSEMMEVYRKTVSYSVMDISVKSPVLFNQATKVITVISYIYIYIIIRNLFNKDKIKNNLLYIATIVLFFVYSFGTGGRMPLLKLLAFSALICFVFANRKYNWKKDLNMKIISTGAICLVVMLVGFYATKNIVGRRKSFDPLYYVTMYSGGSIKLFDSYLQSPTKKSNIIGKETFYGINTFLGRFGLSDQNYIKHLEFRYAKNGLSLGNVYTPFRRYYADFGLIGSIILTCLFAIIINFIYLYIKEKVAKREDYNKDLFLVLYGFIIYCLFLYSIDDQFYGVILSVNYFSILLITAIMYFLLVYLDLGNLIKKGLKKPQKNEKMGE